VGLTAIHHPTVFLQEDLNPAFFTGVGCNLLGDQLAVVGIAGGHDDPTAIK
jgi:hypothetical protein